MCVFLTIFFLSLSILKSETTNTTVVKGGGYSLMGAYEPNTIKSLNGIPKPIKDKVVNHLKARLGEPFYNFLKFTDGRVVDFKELYLREPNAKDYQWEVPAYNLYFRFRRPDLGIKSYTAQIKLRSDGSIIEEIDLPNFSSSPNKLKIISLNEAKRIAFKKGFNDPLEEIEINYDKNSDSLIWIFSKQIADDGLTTKYKDIWISAHDGKTIKEFISESMR